MTSGPDVGRVMRIAEEARTFLEPRWDAWRVLRGRPVPRGERPSHGMCRMSACFLKQALESEMPDDGWMWVGGRPEPGDDIDPDYGVPGGFRPTPGSGDLAADEWFAHYWVVDDEFSLVADITADQFGADPVIVDSDADWDMRRWRDNFAEGVADGHMRDVEHLARQRLIEWAAGHPPGWSVAPDAVPELDGTGMAAA